MISPGNRVAPAIFSQHTRFHNDADILGLSNQRIAYGSHASRPLVVSSCPIRFRGLLRVGARLFFRWAHILLCPRSLPSGFLLTANLLRMQPVESGTLRLEQLLPMLLIKIGPLRILGRLQVVVAGANRWTDYPWLHVS